LDKNRPKTLPRALVVKERLRIMSSRKKVQMEIPNIMYQWVKDKPQKVIDHISPSALGGCMRAHFYQIKHVPYTTPPNPGALLNFQVGFLWEEIVKKSLEHAGLKFKEQWELEDKELNVKGTLDFAILHDSGEVEVLDSKTESVFSERYRKSQKKDYLETNDRYVIQVGTYMLLLKRKGYNVERAGLISIVKDNGMVREYYVPFTPSLEQRIMERIHTLNEHLKNNTVPECECHDWEVGYSNYGNPNTMKANAKGKMICTESCPDSIEKLEEWREQWNQQSNK